MGGKDNYKQFDDLMRRPSKPPIVPDTVNRNNYESRPVTSREEPS